MLDLYENIRRLRKELHLSQEELAKLTGYTDRSSIAKIEKGEVDLPQSKIRLFAQALHVSMGTLMGETGILPPFDNISPIATRSFPVLGSVACGEPKFMDEEIELYIDALTDIDADYVLKAKGDSMIGARINDGDIVFVRKQPVVENGEIAVVAIDDEATLKRFYKYQDIIVLRAENPDFKDIEIRESDGKKVSILGKAVAFQSDVK